MNGPMYESRTDVPGPITAGPRTVLAATDAPISTTTGPISRFRINIPVDSALQRTEDQPVGLQHVVFLARVDPIVANCLGADVETRVDQPLNRVCDLVRPARMVSRSA